MRQSIITGCRNPLSTLKKEEVRHMVFVKGIYGVPSSPNFRCPQTRAIPSLSREEIQGMQSIKTINKIIIVALSLKIAYDFHKIALGQILLSSSTICFLATKHQLYEQIIQGAPIEPTQHPQSQYLFTTNKAFLDQLFFIESKIKPMLLSWLMISIWYSFIQKSKPKGTKKIDIASNAFFTATLFWKFDFFLPNFFSGSPYLSSNRQAPPSSLNLNPSLKPTGTNKPRAPTPLPSPSPEEPFKVLNETPEASQTNNTQFTEELPPPSPFLVSDFLPSNQCDPFSHSTPLSKPRAPTSSPSPLPKEPFNVFNEIPQASQTNNPPFNDLQGIQENTPEASPPTTDFQRALLGELSKRHRRSQMSSDGPIQATQAEPTSSLFVEKNTPLHFTHPTPSTEPRVYSSHNEGIENHQKSASQSSPLQETQKEPPQSAPFTSFVHEIELGPSHQTNGSIQLCQLQNSSNWFSDPTYIINGQKNNHMIQEEGLNASPPIIAILTPPASPEKKSEKLRGAAPPEPNTRDNMLGQIRNFKMNTLKRVGPQEKQKPPNVTSIEQALDNRRKALYGSSDSEHEKTDDTDDSDSDWD